MSLFDALDATWPAAEFRDAEGWRLRRGAGGGKRVSAATRLDAGAEVEAAEAAMAAWGQEPLFQIRGEGDLDAVLAARGYAVADPTLIYAAPASGLADDRPETSRIFRCDRAAALMAEIWAEGGIGPGRLAVMNRSVQPRLWLCARLGDRPAGVGFVSVAGSIAMIHAIEIMPHQRRHGAAEMLVRAAAGFAVESGAGTLALAVTKANAGANSLYVKLGMEVVSEYHYRLKP